VATIGHRADPSGEEMHMTTCNGKTGGRTRGALAIVLLAAACHAFTATAPEYREPSEKLY
jgi:hypothetical protein